MIGLGLKGENAGSNVDVRAGFRSGWFKNIGIAIGGAGSAAIVLGGFDLVRNQPVQSFELLRAWGPWFLLAMFAIAVAGKFLDGINSTMRESFNMVASGVQASAEASGRTADALTRLAEQGGKQAEEVRMLAVFAAREFPGVYTRLDKQDAELAEHGEMLREILKNLKRSRSGDNDGK